MARILIGNIIGPQGIQGPKGVQGIQGPQGVPGPLPPLTNNALATVPGIAALDAVMGKTLNDKDVDLQKQLTQLNGDWLAAEYKAIGLTNSMPSSVLNLVATTGYGKFKAFTINFSNVTPGSGLGVGLNYFGLVSKISGGNVLAIALSSSGKLYCFSNISETWNPMV